MPILELTYPTDALGSDEALGAVAQSLTSIVLRAEKAPDTKAARQMTLVYFHEVPASRAFIAGVPAETPAVVLRVTVPPAAISLRRCQNLIGETTDVLSEACRSAAPEVDPPRVIVVVGEVGDGFLGLDGRAVTLPDLARMAGADSPAGPL